MTPDDATPVCCRWCHREESRWYLLNNNHGGEHGIHWGICVSMSLTRNHVIYFVKRLTLGASIAPGPDDRRPLTARERDNDIEQLDVCLDRAAAVWPDLSREQWFHDAAALHLVLTGRRDALERAPEHALVGATEEVGLW